MDEMRIGNTFRVNQAVFLSHRIYVFIQKFPLKVSNKIGELLFTASALPSFIVLFSDLH